MCAISVVTAWGQTMVPVETWTRSNWSEYQEILKRLADLDEKLGMANCEDPAKAAWMKSVEDRLAALEQR